MTATMLPAPEVTTRPVENRVEIQDQKIDKPREIPRGFATGVLVRQPHGGALRNGGTNRGGPGRPSSAFKKFYRELLEAQREREARSHALAHGSDGRPRKRVRCGVCQHWIGSLKKAVSWPKSEGSTEFVYAHSWCRDLIVLRQALAAVESNQNELRRRKPISTRLRSLILERDEFCCRRCGSKAPDVRLEIDHIIPVVAGGPTEESNLQTLCEECNAGKADRPPTAHDLAAVRR